MKTEFKGKLWAVKTPNWLCIYFVQGLMTFMLWSSERQSQGSRHSPLASDHTSPRSPMVLSPFRGSRCALSLLRDVADGASFYGGRWETRIFRYQNFPFEITQMCSLKIRWDSLHQVSQFTFRHEGDGLHLPWKRSSLDGEYGRGGEWQGSNFCETHWPGVWPRKPLHAKSSLCADTPI